MSLILQYKFISTDTITTDSIGPYDSALSTGTIQVTDVGTYGPTAHFDGSTRFTIQNVPTTLTNNSARSISAWIYPTTSPNNNTILTTGQGSGIHQFIHRASDQKINLGNVVNGVTSSAAIPHNTWSHVGITYTPSTAILFVNGTLVDQNNIMAWNLTLQDMQYLGGRENNENYFNGNMVDFRVYDYDIGTTEMTSIYTFGPDITSLTADEYTHLVDLSWQGGSSVYSLTRTFNTTTYDIVTDTTDTSARVLGLFPGETHTFKLWIGGTDVQTVVVTLPFVYQTSVTDLVEIPNNDLTILSEDAMDDITDSLPSILVAGDVLNTRIQNGTVTQERKDITFVSGSASVDSGGYLLPFSVNQDSGQSITLTTPDASSTPVTFDEITSTLTVDSIVLNVGDSIIIGNRKVIVYELD